jgi:hypothetical protein
LIRLHAEVEYSLDELASLVAVRAPQVVLAIEGADTEDGANVSLRVCADAASAMRRALADSADERAEANHVDAVLSTSELRITVRSGSGRDRSISVYTISHLSARDHAPLRATIAAADLDLRDMTTPTQRATE